ncbi:MAG: FAD:protein FMN transferase [Candidatus Doudnabacteria bacterium]|nr:FAD:protein FMN transferase [Candidatus Doudnabacteria bacterium]
MPNLVKWQEKFEAIGTQWVIDIFDVPDSLNRAELFQKIHSRIVEFDLAYSRFRSDSLVTQMSRQAGSYVLPEDATLLLELYEKLYLLTEGKLTPLIGRTLEQAGYDANYSLKSQKLVAPLAWDEVIAYEPSSCTLILKQPALLDFGAAGKGYLVDIVSDIIENHGIKSYTVDAGSDIRYRGQDVLKVGLENPNDVAQAIGIADLKNQSLCASAGNRRKWEGFHHIINPYTLKSPQDILATWAIAETTLVADGIATALFLTTPETLTSHFKFDYLILYSDFSIKKSTEFPAELFLA